MGLYNRDSGYGGASFRGQHINSKTTGRTFMVASSTEPNFNQLADEWKPDPDGNVRLYTTITAALAACTAGRADLVLLSPGFTTAPTLTELATCGTKGAYMEQAGGKLLNDYVTLRATGAIPQSGSSPIFTVTAPVRVVDIIGEITTAIQAQATSVNLCLIPTVGSSVDLCSLLNINAGTVGTTYNITGTLATAMATNANGVQVAQAAAIMVPAGTINLFDLASSTGSIKWTIRYLPLVPGARVFAA